jgi:hypothetical protein
MTIEGDKELLGFKPGASARYKAFRNNIKKHMEENKFTSKRDAGNEKWQALTKYTLTLKPLSARADVYSTATPAGIALQSAVGNILIDIGKKLKDTHILLSTEQDEESTPLEGDSGTQARPARSGMYSILN